MMAGGRRLDELKGIRTKAALKLGATVVRLGADFHDGIAHAEARSGREIGRGDIEIHDKVIAGFGERLAVGDEFRDVAADDSDLARGIAARSAVPFVAWNGFLEGDPDAIQWLVHTRSATADDERHAAEVLGWCGQCLEPGFEISKGTVEHPSGRFAVQRLIGLQDISHTLAANTMSHSFNQLPASLERS